MKNTNQLSIDFSKPLITNADDEQKIKMEEKISDHLYYLRRMIARNCMYLRKNVGVTQEDLAHKIGLSQSHINYVESGLGNPSVGILAKIAKGLEVELTEFFVKSIWEMDHYDKEAFSIIKGAKFELKKMAIQLPMGWDFQRLSLEPGGEIHVPAKKKMFRQFYFCSQGSVSIKSEDGEMILQKEEGAAIAGPQPLKMINRSDERSEVIHLCYREK